MDDGIIINPRVLYISDLMTAFSRSSSFILAKLLRSCSLNRYPLGQGSLVKNKKY